MMDSSNAVIKHSEIKCSMITFQKMERDCGSFYLASLSVGPNEPKRNAIYPALTNLALLLPPSTRITLADLDGEIKVFSTCREGGHTWAYVQWIKQFPEIRVTPVSVKGMHDFSSPMTAFVIVIPNRFSFPVTKEISVQKCRVNRGEWMNVKYTKVIK